MRSLLLFALLISFGASAQLQGSYTRDGEAYQFYNDGSFDWLQTSPTAITYGNGTYKVDVKKITLNFTKARLQPEVQLNASPETPNNKSVVEVRLMYSNGNAATNANISFVNSGIMQRVSSFGILKIEITNPSPEEQIVVDVDNRKSAEIPITLKGHDTLLGIVIDETAQYKDNLSQTFSFKQKRGKIVINKKTFKRS